MRLDTFVWIDIYEEVITRFLILTSDIVLLTKTGTVLANRIHEMSGVKGFEPRIETAFAACSNCGYSLH